VAEGDGVDGAAEEVGLGLWTCPELALGLGLGLGARLELGTGLGDGVTGAGCRLTEGPGCWVFDVVDGGAGLTITQTTSAAANTALSTQVERRIRRIRCSPMAVHLRHRAAGGCPYC